MSIAPWILLAVLVVTLIGDSVLLAVASYRRRRFRERWGAAPAAGSLAVADGRSYTEQRVPDIVAARPFVRADQRRAR